MSQTEIKTSLGYPLIKNEEGWRIDLSELKVFTGLSVLGGIVGDILEDRVKKSPGDLAFLYKINASINPELIELGLSHIQIYGQSDLLNDIVLNNSRFIDDLITVFGTLQRPSWRLKLHPEDSACSPDSVSTSLVFPFTYRVLNEERRYSIILERGISADSQDGHFLRLSYEAPHRGRLNLENIPHVEVNDLKNRVYIAGSTRMAGSIRDNVLAACNRGIKEYVEENRSFSHLFLQMEKTRLGRLEKIVFNWDAAFSRFIGDLTQEHALLIFKKMFLSFEAGSICNQLKLGEAVSVELEGCFFTVYLSQLNRVLNININLPRSVFSGDKYLKRMPQLEQVARRVNKSLDFADTGIFLIHHITSEIVATIEAIRLLNADGLHALFVKYGGVVPTDYLETLLEIPSDYLFSAGLQRRTTETNRNYFTLSDDLSDLSGLSDLETVLRKEKLDFMPAMRLVAGHLFLKFCLLKSGQHKKVLLIEDGGYLAPVVNQLALSDALASDVFQQFYVSETAPEGSFRNWLSPLLIGSVEHTKNGYDRLRSVLEERGNLAFPAFSIAISDNKLKEESQEVAHSILSAIESILHGNGLVLSQRKTALLGAQGNIGRFLGHYLEKGRLHANSLPLIRVDKSYDISGADRYHSLDVIPDSDFLDIEMFIGVTGISLLRGDLLKKLILEGTKSRLFFASGSTKTVEFSEVSLWLSRLFEADRPTIDGVPVELTYSRIVDPQSGLDQGSLTGIQFQKKGSVVEKTLYLLNDLTPVNFLYYGVPTETMDLVLSQLITTSLGLVDVANNKGISPGLYAVDHEIDEWGNLI